ncbi:MAG: hypothetical protein KKB34_18670 [Bacteroidetes bacterium]|nr:hypothetical protein [Bacteroidota bacterium]
MSWYYWIILLIVAVIFVRWYGPRPYYHKNKTVTDFKSFIASLLSQFTEGTFIVFERKSGDGFLQVVLNTYSESKIEVEFGLPEISWSEEYFHKVIDYVQQNNFEIIVEADSGQEVKRFLRVFISGSEEEIISNTYKLMFEVVKILQWNETDKYVIHYEGQLDRRAVENTLKGLNKLPDSFIKQKLVKFNINILKEK